MGPSPNPAELTSRRWSVSSVRSTGASVFLSLCLAPLLPLTAQPLDPPPPLSPRDASRADCPGCDQKLKKRLAVMPVKVGGLSAELGLPGDFVAAKVRDALEAQISQGVGFVLVNRAELGDVIAEQQLASTSLFNQELAPPSRKLIPAQMLLYVTVDAIDISRRVTEDSASGGEELMRRAADLEAAADRAQDRARQEALDHRRRTGTRGSTHAYQTDCNAQHRCQEYTTPGEQRACEILRSQCERRNQTARQNAEADRRRSVSNGDRAVTSAQADADRYRRQAQEARRQAEFSSTESSRLEQQTATMTLVWKALDTATGTVLAGGKTIESSSLRRNAQSSQSAFQDHRSTLSTRYDALINRVLSLSVTRLASQVEARLVTEPFRAKVVRADGNVVVINAGQSIGMTPGQTFGVREKASVLTDPDTGELLSEPGLPVGLLWVFKCEEKVSYARILKSAGPISRGDELEWIGFYTEPPPV